MKNFSKPLGLLLLCLGGIAACNKDDDQSPSVTKTELLAGKSAKTWRPVASTKNGNDQFSSRAACDKDDNFIFRADQTFEANEGATKCNTSDLQVFNSGSWEFKSNETVLSIAGDDFSLLELSANTLRFKETDGSDSYEHTFTAQ